MMVSQLLLASEHKMIFSMYGFVQDRFLTYLIMDDWQFTEDVLSYLQNLQ